MSRYYRESPMKYILPAEITTGLDVGMASVEAQNPELYQSSSTTATSTTQKKTIFDYLPWILVAILIFVLFLRK